MNNIKIKIPEQLVNYIEALQYDREGLKDLIARISQLHNITKTWEGIQSLNNFWFEKYLNINAEYNMAKQELENEYIKPLIIDDKKYDWFLDFTSNEVTLKYYDKEN